MWAALAGQGGKATEPVTEYVFLPDRGRKLQEHTQPAGAAAGGRIESVISRHNRLHGAREQALTLYR